MLLLDSKLALVTFLTFPLLAIASVVFRIVSHGAYRATRERIAAVTAYLQETLSGVRVVRSFGQEPRHAAAMDRAQRGQPRGQHEDRLPQRHLLPGGGTALGRRHRGDHPLRRHPGDRRRDPDRRRSSPSSATCRSSSTRSSSSPSSTRPTSRGWRRSTRSSSCSTPSRTWSTRPARRPGHPARRDRDGGGLLLLRRRR